MMLIKLRSCRLRVVIARSQLMDSLMGGTFMSMPEDYRHKFIAGLHNALSGHTSEDVDEAVK